MNKLLSKFNSGEDLILNFYKSRPVLATLNFDNKHIQSRPNFLQEKKGFLKVFSWTENRFRLVLPKDIKSTFPLAAVLKNKR